MSLRFCRAPGLESLSLPLRKWDEEIMYPTTDFFQKLRKLKILYDEGHPSEHIKPLSEVPSQTTGPTHVPTLYSYAFPPPSSPKSSPPATSNNATSRPHFIAAYGNQPTSTNFEELAFPLSSILHISHKLMRPMPTLHTRRLVYVGAAAGPVVAPANALQAQQHHHHAGIHAFLAQQPSQLAPTSYKSPPGNPVLPPRFGTESTLGLQAGPTREVLGCLAAWRKHCKKLIKCNSSKITCGKGLMKNCLGLGLSWMKKTRSSSFKVILIIYTL
ncbi:hypothetical protein F5887DRAFT_1091941 [Amanita rubescens]|nr:hypothetical protein F5887DRAFT_1091941 [Amanita rubescens]